jgi:hypothetical protein
MTMEGPSPLLPLLAGRQPERRPTVVATEVSAHLPANLPTRAPVCLPAWGPTILKQAPDMN